MENSYGNLPCVNIGNKIPNENIKLKQFVYLFVNKGFRKCEVWKESEYIKTHSKTKQFRSHLIASQKINLLHELGIAYKDARKLVILSGNQKVNKKTLSLLGAPIWIGTIENLSNLQNLWDKTVCNCYITGFFRNKIHIIVKDGDTDA